VEQAVWEERIKSIEDAVAGLDDERRKAILLAVADLLALWLPDPFGERRPTAQTVPPVQTLRTVVNRLRVSAGGGGS
jgi:hypothetical protein